MSPPSFTEGSPPVAAEATTITVTASYDLMGGKAGRVDPAPTVLVVVPQDTTNYDLTGGTVNDDGEFTISITLGGSDDGMATGTFTVTPRTDTIFEAHKTITVSASTTLIDMMDSTKRSASADLTLNDDDHEISLTAAPDTVKEEDGKKKVTVTVTLSKARSADTTIPVTVSTNAAFYNLSASALAVEIDASEMTGTASFDITPIDNSMYNGNQEIRVDLGASSDLVLRDVAKITLVDDEELPALALSTDPEEVAEGGGAQRVTVTATLMDGVLLPTSTTVNVTVSEDSDQYATSGTSLTITIPANQGSGTGTITITPVSDNAFETTASQVTFTGKAQLISGDKDSDRGSFGIRHDRGRRSRGDPVGYSFHVVKRADDAESRDGSDRNG